MRLSLLSLPIRTLPLLLAVALAGCETPLNDARLQRQGGLQPPAAPEIKPQVLALGLQAAPSSAGLSAESLRLANELLTRQGRLQAQVLTLTPFNDRGRLLAERLALTLVRSGARPPQVQAVPVDAARLAEAAAQHWDLELRSEALVVTTADCRIADARAVALRPFDGVGALGCANRSNLARMVRDPRDLSRPRVLGPADGKAAAAAIDRYQSGEIRTLIDIDFDEN